MTAREAWDAADARLHAEALAIARAKAMELSHDPEELEAVVAGDEPTILKVIERDESRNAETRTRPIRQILASIETFVGRFVTFANTHQSAAVALWIAHVHAIDAAPSAAYLRITSAAEEAGKTTLLECLEALLGERALNAVSVSPAALFRTRDKVGPVALLLDEIDNTLRDRKDDGARDLLALVNAGYRRSAAVLRTVGKNHEARRFAAFGPAAIAGLGNLHPTTESRCIPIVLERKLTTQGERWLPFLFEDEIEALRGELEEWANPEVVDQVRHMTPSLPAGLRDRHAEVWWSMFSIADLAAGEWPQRARNAATVLHGERDANATIGVGVLLLRHIHQAFEEAAVDRLASVDLLNRLVANEEGPWGRWWGGELKRDGPPSAAAADLSAKLRPFGPKPRTIRVGDATPRGYLLDDFTKPFAQYQVGIPPATPATPATDDPKASDLRSEPPEGFVAPVAPVAGGKPINGAGPYSTNADAIQSALGWAPLEKQP
jgi:hypothetical protein